MKSLSTQEQYEYFVYTLNHCGMFLLDSNEDDIGFYIFEEFDSDSVPFLSRKLLRILLYNRYINYTIYKLSRQLYHKFRNLENTAIWGVSFVKTEKEWREVLELSDKIKELVAQLENKRKTKKIK